MAKKQTSDKVSTIAARVLGAGNPLRTDEGVRLTLGRRVVERIGEITPNEQDPTHAFVAVADAVADTLEDMIADMRTLAASALGQDETPK